MTALSGITVVDRSGTIATSYCAKLFADYGATVINLEPETGFQTRRLPPFVDSAPRHEASAMHAWLQANKLSVVNPRVQPIIERADVVLDDGSPPDTDSLQQAGVVHSSISWFGSADKEPYADYQGTDAICFSLNGMLAGIGKPEGPPMIPTGYQAQIIGGLTAFIGTMSQVLGAALAATPPPAVHLQTSILEATLCFTEVGAVGAFNTGVRGTRMGVNRFPPTYPLGVFPCRDGWLGVTALTPGQWRSFCALLDLEELAARPQYQSTLGRLADVEVLEPLIKARLLERSAEDIFYAGQRNAVPLARVPTMDELFSVDQFMERNAFAEVRPVDQAPYLAPVVPFRLFETPPHFGGPVSALGADTDAVINGHS